MLKLDFFIAKKLHGFHSRSRRFWTSREHRSKILTSTLLIFIDIFVRVLMKMPISGIILAFISVIWTRYFALRAKFKIALSKILDVVELGIIYILYCQLAQNTYRESHLRQERCLELTALKFPVILVLFAKCKRLFIKWISMRASSLSLTFSRLFDGLFCEG